MKKSLTLLFAALLTFAAAWADEPFLKHRYDLFKVLPPAEGSIVFVGNSITDCTRGWKVFAATKEPCPS